MEWTIPAFTPQPQSITALWLVLISRPTEGRRLSWPGSSSNPDSWFTAAGAVTRQKQIRVLCRDIWADVLIEELEHERNAVGEHEMLTHVFKLYSIHHNSSSLRQTAINDYKSRTAIRHTTIIQVKLHQPVEDGEFCWSKAFCLHAHVDGNWCIRNSRKMLKFSSTMSPTPSPYVNWGTMPSKKDSFVRVHVSLLFLLHSWLIQFRSCQLKNNKQDW